MAARSSSRRALLAAVLAASAPARAQGAAPRRVGVLAPSTAAREAVTLKPFFDEMARLGWIEGRTVVYDRAYANDQAGDLSRLAVELVARRPEAIFAPPQVAAVAARGATASIPIVFATGTDPVGVGLATSMARPGGNVSGMISVFESLAPKQLELARQLLPSATRFGFIGSNEDPRFAIDHEALVRHLPRGATLRALSAADLPALEAAVRQLVRERVEAVFTATSLAFNGIDRIVEVTRPAKVPIIAHRGAMVDRGALMAYGAVLSDQIARAAQVVDKVLRGARIGDIPIEQPNRFEFVLHRGVANALGITVAPALLVRADRVVE